MDLPVCLPFEAFAELRPERQMPPLFERLWVRGSLDGLRKPTIAVVGTRAASAYGRALAARFCADFAAAGCCVISGLALGIDAAAHVGTLQAGGVTVGVLGGGHDCFFPKRNRGLAERMVRQNGAVLSPFPPDAAAYPSQFLQRNGVVAALSDAVVVIEAPARSGALNTAGWAAARIPVFAVPGNVDRAHVAGCHALIRDGAILARSAHDVLADLRIASPAQAATPGRSAARERSDPLERTLLARMSEGECSLEELIAHNPAGTAGVLAALSVLELSGEIEARPGQRYSLR